MAKHKNEYTHGLGHGFAKALKAGVNGSVKRRKLEQSRDFTFSPKARKHP